MAGTINASVEHGQHELADTHVSPSLARGISLVFVVFISSVPLLQVAVELFRGRTPGVVDVFRRPPTFANLRAFENELQRASVCRQAVQPRVQLMLAALGFGNDKTAIGRDGWLFYQPGIDYVTGAGFLDPSHCNIRAKKNADKGNGAATLDPRSAILAFDADCKRAGVHLVLAPIPDKCMLEHGHLVPHSRDMRDGLDVNNADFQCFAAELGAAGVDVFYPDATELTHAGDAFLIHDTHWTPEFMEAYAERLAAHVLASTKPDVPAATRMFKLQKRSVACSGDLVSMLQLPPEQTLFEPQQVTLNQVLDEAAGAEWKPSLDSEVLLLGDSFTNIFSDGANGLGWGSAAGLAPHLSLRLKCSVDVIALNGSGVSLTRAELARRADPLRGKKVVIWEFAIRELTDESADWKQIAIASKTTAPADHVLAGDIEVRAEVLMAPPRIDMTRSPYKNAIVTLKCRTIQVARGELNAAEFLLKMPLVINRIEQPVAHVQKGQIIRLRLMDESKVPAVQRTWTPANENDDLELPLFWAERIEPAR